MTKDEKGRAGHGRAAIALVAGLTAGSLLAGAVASAHVSTPAGHSTLEQTICGPDPVAACGDPETGFKTLKTTPGESYLLREELAAARAGREARRRSLIYLGQITDFQLADEESPAREERFDAEPLAQLSNSGFRPHEALVPHAVEASIREMNRFLQSPVTQGDGSRARLANAVMTGDLADNMQFNETQWVRTLLEGGTVDPNSGVADAPCNLLGLDIRIPLPADDPDNYTGVQDYDDYLLDNALYYDPDSPLGVYANRDWPTYPANPATGKSLLDRAQDPFQAEGLEVPSYVAFGNHDGLYQGTIPAFPPLVTTGLTFEQTALGCIKPVYPLTDQDALLRGLSLTDVITALQTGKAITVPPDPNRRFVDHPQFKQLFQGGGQQDGHGFDYVDAGEEADSNGHAAYYSFSPKPGIRYIVLDTLAEGVTLLTGAGGNIDDPQFRWLAGELEDAERNGELVIAFGHHATGSLDVANPDEISLCLGLQANGHDLNPSCDLDPRLSAPIHDGEELKQLFLAHPNVISYVAGHSHENQITPFPAADGSSGFWEIKSPAIADWPPQNRMIEVMDNRDGTLSIFGTLTDHGAPVDAPNSGTDLSGAGVETLASLAREFTFNDPQSPPEGPDGTLADRNVELILADPRGGGGGGGSLGASAGACANLLTGSRRADRRLTGTSASDRILGLRGADRIKGLGGDDCLFGNKGSDRVLGDAGNDRISGGNRRDRLVGGPGNDRIRAGSGGDVIKARDGEADRIDCGGGFDVAIADRADRVRGCERVRRKRAAG